MGNRAVITTAPTENNKTTLGVYLHWNGGRDSVRSFCAYAAMTNQRAPENDCYGWARLCQIIGNFFGGNTSIGIDTVNNLDCNNGDNGVYIIKGWKIIGREFHEGAEQDEYDLEEFLQDIDSKMPEKDRLGREKVSEWVREHGREYL